MSAISTGQASSQPITENIVTPVSTDYNQIQHHKQHSSNTAANMLPPTSCSAMSNSSSQIDLFSETPSKDNTGPVCVGPDSYINDDVLDLSSTGLEKLNRAAAEYVLSSTTLLLDNNCLQRLDNIHTYQCLEKVISLIVPNVSYANNMLYSYS